MGRHRADPHGIGRMALFGVALTVVIGLIGAGGYAINGVINTGAPRAEPRLTPEYRAQTTVEPPQALQITAARGPCRVFVRVPGGDIRLNRTLRQGEAVRFDDARLEVVVADARAVQVVINGRRRLAGRTGRQVFTVVKNTQTAR